MTTIAFDFAAGSGRLSGRLEMPAATPRGWAVFAHCLTCGKESHAAVRISRSLAAAGIGVLRFDFAGVGRSAARPEVNGIAGEIEDLHSAISAMTHAGMEPRLLVGHSFGAAAALAAAVDVPGIAAAALIAPPADIPAMLRRIGPDRVPGEEAAQFALDGRDFIVTDNLLGSLGSRSPARSAAAFGRPLLVLQPLGDTIVGQEDAELIYAAASQPKSLVALDSAGHLLTDRGDADYAAAIISAWSSRYLARVKSDLERPEEALGVTAVETGHGEYQLAMKSGIHSFIADEPVAAGGLDTGLSPYDFVSAGLAACTTMTMRLYAKRKHMPLDRATTHVEHRKVEGDPPRDLFTRTITLEGALDAEQRSRILAIANRCPVDLTLVRGSDVETILTD